MPAKLWRSDMGIEPTQDGITAPQTVLKTAPVTRPEAAPRTDNLRHGWQPVKATPVSNEGVRTAAANRHRRTPVPPVDSLLRYR